MKPMEFDIELLYSALRNVGVVFITSGFLDAVFATKSFFSYGTLVIVFGIGLVYIASYRPKKASPKSEEE